MTNLPRIPICPQCHAVVSGSDKFCGKCGTSQQTEHKEATSLTQHSLNVSEVKFRLGVVYYKKNNLPSAASMWRDVLALDPGHQGAKEMLEQIGEHRRSDGPP